MRTRSLLPIAGASAVLAALSVLTACSQTEDGRPSGALPPPTTPSSSGSATSFPSSSTSMSTSMSSSAPSTSSVPGSATSSAGLQPIGATSVTTGAGTFSLALWGQKTITDCAAHSYGAKVIAYFRRVPCRGAEQRLWTFPAGNGKHVVLSAVSVVAGRGAHDPTGLDGAAELVRLENGNGTGSINDLFREGGRVPGFKAIPSDEVFQVVGQDTGVVVFDAWCTEGRTDPQDKTLRHIERSFFLTPVSAFPQ